MEKKERTAEKYVCTKNKQPVKMITQQDIRLLKNTLNNLHSWIDVLEPMKEFFTMNSEQINKRKVVREFYAHSQVFLTFYESYLINISLLEKKIIVLEQKEKLKVNSNCS